MILNSENPALCFDLYWFFFSFCVYLLCACEVGMRVPQHPWRGQRSTFRSHFLLSTRISPDLQADLACLQVPSPAMVSLASDVGFQCCLLEFEGRPLQVRRPNLLQMETQLLQRRLSGVQEILGHGEGWGGSWETASAQRQRAGFCSAGLFSTNKIFLACYVVHTHDLPGESPGMENCRN